METSSLPKHDSPTLQPIAIVGIAAELPSGNKASHNLDVKKFSEFLLNGGESYEEILPERFNVDSWSGRALGQVVASTGSFLKGIDMFDHVEFGISAKDARAMAVSTRKLIELAFLAFLDSGIDYRGQNVGCFTSGTAFDILSIAEPDEFEARGSFAGAPCMIANKISYHLNLRGPSIPVDTACSSSFTAMHLAIQSIRSGECESAVVAGCQLNLRLADFVQYSQGSVLSPDGKSKPFDADADGFSRGEGAVAVILKSRTHAVADGDYIYGTILGSGINSSGSMAPVYAPATDGQVNAMQRAYQGTGLDPRNVDYVEMHATGTSVGDPVECNWVGKYLGRETELLVGSVKGNIGHLEIASFLASLVKTCLIFESGIVPPNVNITRPNPAVKWEEYGLRIPLQATPIKARSSSGKLLISINSSGIGGVNGHVVLEGPNPNSGGQYPDADHSNIPVLLVAGGLSPRSANTIGDDMTRIVNAHPDRRTLISTIYGRRARQMTWRTFLIALPESQPISTSFPPPVLSPRIKAPIVFLFSGQGPQHLKMGCQLFEIFPAFRQSILQLDHCHHTVTGFSLIERTGLFTDLGASQTLTDVWPISIILPSLAMVQIAMFDLLRYLGVCPDIVVGHSAGEVAMMYASGAGSKEMVMELVIARGQAMSLLENLGGTMAALACSPSQARSIIDSVAGSATVDVLEIACYNSPGAVVISGHTVLVMQAIELAHRRGFKARRLPTHVPVHSSLMEICRKEYCSLITKVYSRYPGEHHPSIETYSTTTGELLPSFTDQYFWKNCRNPVQFTKGISSILRAHPNASFLEISPHPSLSPYLHELGALSGSVACPMQRSKTADKHHERVIFLKALGQLIVMGHNCINFASLNSISELVQRPELSAYPFVKKHVQYLPDHSRVLQKQTGARGGPLNCMDLRINHLTHPDIAQHIINGESIMPATGFLEMALEFGARILWNVEFRSILPLSSDSPTPVEVVLDQDNIHWSVRTTIVGSHANGIEGHNKLTRIHAQGCMSMVAAEEPQRVDLPALQSRCKRLELQVFYDSLRNFAQYGPAYCRVTEFYLGSDEALVKVRGAASDLPGFEKYVVHPAILDACMHVVVHPSFTANADHDAYYLPSHIGAFAIHENLGHEATFHSAIYAHASLKQWLPNRLIVDVCVVNELGVRLCTIQDLAVDRHHKLPPRSLDRRFDVVYQPFGLAQRLEFLDTPLPSGRTQSSCDDCSLDCHTYPAYELSSASLLDELQNTLGGILHHITQVCGKKIVRVLEINNHASSDISQQLSSILETSQDDVHITYFVSSRHIEAISRERKHVIPFEIHRTAPLETSGLPAGSFDVVVGVQSLMERGPSPKELQTARALLLPGGCLVLAEMLDTDQIRQLTSVLAGRDDVSATLPAQWKDLLRSLGFRSSILINGGHSSPFFIINSQKEVLSIPSDPTIPKRKDLLVLPYFVGQETNIQNALVKLGKAVRTTIWVTTTNSTDTQAARGFTRSLIRELPHWNVSLASFTFPCPLSEQVSIMHFLTDTPGMEAEIVVNEDRNVLVPRFYQTPPPSISTSANTFSIDLGPDHLRMSVIATSSAETNLYCVVGLVTEVQSNSESHLLHARIIAFATKTPTRHALVHTGSLAIDDLNIPAEDMVRLAPVLLLGGMALGFDYLRDPSRHHLGRCIVTHCDSAVGELFLWFLRAIGLQPLGITSVASPLQLASLRLQSDDIIFSGYEDHDLVFRSFLPQSCSVIYWRSPSNVVQVLKERPWTIGDMLRVVMAKIRDLEPPVSVRLYSLAPAPAAPEAALFKSDEVYLLLGGIGSLGLHISVWMYENGARHMVLTSRSGRDSLHRSRDILALRMLNYLESRNDLFLQLEAFDASSADAMTKTLQGLTRPIAGCMLLSAFLEDAMFYEQDSASFERVFRPKLGSFDALDAALEIRDLDFLIAFSSTASFGNAGQTNYASANTALEGRTEKYRNAFSIVVPAIRDTRHIAGSPENGYYGSAFQHLLPWSLSARDVQNCIKDGILKLKDGPYNLYIPDLAWNLVEKYLGPSSLYGHLVQSTTPSTVPADNDSGDMLRHIILQHLDVDPAEFSPDIPLTSYGVDSLSAGRLSVSLRPLLLISQMQLLADLSFNDIKGLIDDRESTGLPADTQPGLYELFNWEKLNNEQTLVKLVDFGGNPLILVHGGAGTIVSFIPMQFRFTTSLWALQTTPETPMYSITAIAQFYYQNIKAARPYGPYRIGSFSGASLIGLALAKLMEAAGDEIVQLVIIDHSPLLFAYSAYLDLDEETIRMRSPGPDMIQRGIDTLVRLSNTTKDRNAPERQRHVGVQLSKGFESAAKGEAVPPHVQAWFSTVRSIVISSYEFMFSLLPSQIPYSENSMQQALIQWMKTIQAPVTAYFASNGVLSMIPEDRRAGWEDGGIRRAFPNAQIITVESSHFEMLELSTVTDHMQTSFGSS